MKEKTERNKTLYRKYQEQKVKNYHSLARMFKIGPAAVWRIIKRMEGNNNAG